MLRSDHGREFQNQSSEILCKQNEISYNFSAPRTPKKIRLLKEKIDHLKSS